MIYRFTPHLVNDRESKYRIVNWQYWLSAGANVEAYLRELPTTHTISWLVTDTNSVLHIQPDPYVVP